MFAAPSFPVFFERYGDRAHLARIDHIEPAHRATLLEYLRAHPSVADAMLTEHHALVVPREEQAFEEHHEVPAQGNAVCNPRRVTIEVRWNGADLEEAARTLGISREALTRTYMARPYTVSFLGFLPGFAYLRGLPPALQLPRRAQVRPRVPARTLAAGGPYLGIYPEVSPGGWWLLGETVGFEPFLRTGPDAGPALRVGDEVSFREARE